MMVPTIERLIEDTSKYTTFHSTTINETVRGRSEGAYLSPTVGSEHSIVQESSKGLSRRSVATNTTCFDCKMVSRIKSRSYGCSQLIGIRIGS